MYSEKETIVLPFAADKKEATVQCGSYAVVFGGLLALLLWLMVWKGYDAGKVALISGIFLVVALVTWLPMVLRCVMKLHLAPEGLRITAFGLPLRRFPLGKIRFVTAMESTGKNGTRQSQLVLCAYTFEELAGLGGWKWGDQRNPPEEAARKYLNRFAGAYYIRELNLSGRFFFLDWSPDRLRLIRWMYPDARWADFTKDHIYDKQMEQ